VELAESVKPLREADVVLRCRVRGEKKNAASGDQPDSANGTDAIFFEVARDSGELARLIVRQAGGIEVEFRFENWRFDPHFRKRCFDSKRPQA